MKITTKRTVLAVAAVLMTVGLGLTGCSSGGGNPTSTGSAQGAKIGLLLPETTTARYESKDKPYFTAALKKECPSCTLLYANASSDASKQQQQAQSMLTQGVKVLVVDPYDGKAAASIVAAASAQNVPVVAYDRLIASPKLTYVISNDYEKVGELQATALVAKLKEDKVPAGSGIIMINGATTDNNALNIAKGAHKIIDASGYKVLSAFATWDPAEAQTFASSQITKFGDQIKAVYSANDGNAEAAISAMKAAGMKVVPTTGLDASLAGLQSIIAGEQYMTVYNSFRGEANEAAKVAVELAQGKKPQSTATVNGIPATLQQPVAVTLDNIKSTVIKDDFYTAKDICTAAYAQACKTAGIE
jgi:ABC-type xylose transport system, periplasmic component